VRVTVTDAGAGAGVPEDLEAKLFDQFARGTNSEGARGRDWVSPSLAHMSARGDLVYLGSEGGTRFELILRTDEKNCRLDRGTCVRVEHTFP
jgi:signal transduction histidine kinase